MPARRERGPGIRAVVTGVGLVSPLGVGARQHALALVEGRRAEPAGDGLPRLEAAPFKPTDWISNRKALRYMSRQTVLACVAARMALDDARVSAEELEAEAETTALVLGGGYADTVIPLAPAVNASVDEKGVLGWERLCTVGQRMLPPLWILAKLPNSAAGQVTILNRIRSLSYTVVNGPGSGAVAVGEAARVVQRSRAARVVCGASEGLAPADFLWSLKDAGVLAMSHASSAPFQPHSEGMLVAEAAACLVVEPRARAAARGAAIYAAIVGYSNRYVPDLNEASRERLAELYLATMRQALDDAGIDARQIGFVQVSAIGVPRLDEAERLALEPLFSLDLPRCAAAWHLGASLGAHGAVGVACAALALREQRVPAVVPNADTPGQRAAAGTPRNLDLNYCLVNCFDHLGGAVSLVLAREDASS